MLVKYNNKSLPRFFCTNYVDLLFKGNIAFPKKRVPQMTGTTSMLAPPAMPADTIAVIKTSEPPRQFQIL